MKLFTVRKDGGPDSTVTGFWLLEIKCLFSICLLRFDGDSREAFHNHAFNCFSWVVRGFLIEEMLDGRVLSHPASCWPFVTRRDDFHKVSSVKPVSWVLSFRGPWSETWQEFIPATKRFQTLGNGRKILN